MQLKLQLQTLNKGNLKMSNYLLKKKNIFDSLAFIGQKMSENDKTMYVLSGLGFEYDLSLFLSLHYLVLILVDIRS